jgi:hypothetical protein
VTHSEGDVLGTLVPLRRFIISTKNKNIAITVVREIRAGFDCSVSFILSELEAVEKTLLFNSDVRSTTQ